MATPQQHNRERGRQRRKHHHRQYIHTCIYTLLSSFSLVFSSSLATTHHCAAFTGGVHSMHAHIHFAIANILSLSFQHTPHILNRYGSGPTRRVESYAITLAPLQQLPIEFANFMELIALHIYTLMYVCVYARVLSIIVAWPSLYIPSPTDGRRGMDFRAFVMLERDV